MGSNTANRIAPPGGESRMGVFTWSDRAGEADRRVPDEGVCGEGAGAISI